MNRQCASRPVTSRETSSRRFLFLSSYARLNRPRSRPRCRSPWTRYSEGDPLPVRRPGGRDTRERTDGSRTRSVGFGDPDPAVVARVARRGAHAAAELDVAQHATASTPPMAVALRAVAARDPAHDWTRCLRRKAEIRLLTRTRSRPVRRSTPWSNPATRATCLSLVLAAS